MSDFTTARAQGEDTDWAARPGSTPGAATSRARRPQVSPSGAPALTSGWEPSVPPELGTGLRLGRRPDTPRGHGPGGAPPAPSGAPLLFPGRAGAGAGGRPWLGAAAGS